jgi:hypothetical protein
MIEEEKYSSDEEEDEGVETLMDNEEPHKMGIIYANLCQSLHIGCNDYQNLKIDELNAKISESHNDVDKYA